MAAISQLAQLAVQLVVQTGSSENWGSVGVGVPQRALAQLYGG